MQSFWFEIVLGGWVLVSPWVLGISSNALGKWSNVIVGLILVLRALWGRYGVHEEKIFIENPSETNHLEQ